MHEQASDVDENNNQISSASLPETQKLQEQCEPTDVSGKSDSKLKSIGHLPMKLSHENETTATEPSASVSAKERNKRMKKTTSEFRNYLALSAASSAQGSTGDSCDTDSASEDGRRLKHVRFGICVLALLGFALGVMSRLILNVSIVEMVHQKPLLVDGESAEEDSTLISIDELGTPFPNINETIAEETSTSASLLDSIGEANLTSPTTGNNNATTTTTTTTGELASNADTNNEEQDDDGLPDADELAGLRFKWTKKEVNMVLGAFYVGYIPGILMAGPITNRYGAKYPIFAAVFGSAVINVLTPLLARTHLYLMVASRIIIGCIQGPCTPCLYDLFGKWLTATESSIFAPMIKVSMPMGALIGTLMPGILSTFGFRWPTLFYLGGSFCFAWSALWLFVATSTPQANKFVGPSELHRITRKKAPPLNQQVRNVLDQSSDNDVERSTMLPTVGGGGGDGDAEKEQHPAESKQRQQQQQQLARQSIPWLKILSNRSVLALTLVKFTYNACMDVLYLELAIYLRDVHSASIETISAIASGTYCIQMIMITFVAWLAKNAVSRKVFGLSKTKWRKIFQGGSNFCMAAAYFALPLVDDNLEPAACLLISAAFFWLLGAGGESLIPYDLSPSYASSIVSFAHSISKFSGLTVPILSQLVLGEESDSAGRWNLLFGLIGGAATIGGLVFVLVVRAKPFLAEEAQQVEQQQQQQQQRQRQKQLQLEQQVDTPPKGAGHKAATGCVRQCRPPSRLESIEED